MSEMQTTAGLTISNVGKQFGTTKVLQDISLEVPPGKLLVLLGHSGCGKSTLLRSIAGLEEIDQGEIRINGTRVDQLTPAKRNVALVFQNYSLYPHMTVRENLAFPLKVARMAKSEITSRVTETAAILDLTDRLQFKPSQLSGGQRQRVALGRAMIRRPSLFLLDEPLSNLDADLRARMRQEIVTLQRRLETTTVHVTHDQIEALTMGDYVALMHEGKVAQFGTPEELYHQPNSLMVARFLGQPPLNVVQGAVENGQLQPLGCAIASEMTSRLSNTQMKIGIRPEHIHIAPSGTLTGILEKAEFLGDHYRIDLRLRDQSLLTTTSIAIPSPVGSSVHFSIEVEKMLFFESGSGKRI